MADFPRTSPGNGYEHEKNTLHACLRACNYWIGTEVLTKQEGRLCPEPSPPRRYQDTVSAPAIDG